MFFDARLPSLLLIARITCFISFPLCFLPLSDCRLAICAIVPSENQTPNEEQTLKIAVLGLAGDQSREVEAFILEGLRLSGQVALIDRAIVDPAVKASGYNGSINMTIDEARKLGSSVGCDFFIIGKAELVRRSISHSEEEQDATAAVMIVDGRNGALAYFDFVAGNGNSSDAARNALTKLLSRRASSYAVQLINYRKLRASVSHSLSSSELIEQMPAEGSQKAIGFVSPEFLNRLKPEYTAQAERADISATVELMVVLRSTGEIGEVQVVRWAGYGLDESAIETVRKLKFKPATREGKAISVKALVRYNFRRT
jgi:TonB family protein